MLLHNSSNSKGFDNVFSEIMPSKKLCLKNNNCLRLFHLDISNNEFSYIGLHSLLQKNIGRYVFSRAMVDKLTVEGDAEAIGLRAVELLRDASNPNDSGAGGELGEILLYLFLEIKLGAPKLLSKMELKTSPNQYVFGSDGIHLLRLDNKIFQLILGESKIKGDLEDAVDNAFNSIKTVSAQPSNELRLVDSRIFTETFDEQTTNFIKSLIIPSKRDASISVDKAFGIFLGYTLGVDASQYSNTEFREVVNRKLKDDFTKVAKYIEGKINNSGLAGYSFYFFLLPFNDASKDRANIIQKLKGGI